MNRAEGRSVTTGFFLVLEGADGSGKSAVAKLLAKSFADQGYAVRTVKRENPVGDPEYAALISAVGQVFRAAAGLGTGFDTLSLAAAAQYSALLESQVLPAVQAGDVVIAESWWAKTWARLGIEARRRSMLSSQKGESFMRWQKSLLEGNSMPDDRLLTVLLEAPEADRQMWYERAGCAAPVYDENGLTSYDPSVFARFTTELGDVLRVLAVEKDWPTVPNSSGRALEETRDEILYLVSQRFGEVV